MSSKTLSHLLYALACRKMQIKKIDYHIMVTLSLGLTLHYHLVRYCKGWMVLKVGEMRI